MLIPVNTTLLQSDIFWSVEFNPFHFHCFHSLYLLSLPSSGRELPVVVLVLPSPHPSPRLVVLTALLSQKYKLTWAYAPLHACFLQFHLSFLKTSVIPLSSFQLHSLLVSVHLPLLRNCGLDISSAMWLNICHTWVLSSSPHGKSGLSLVRILNL